MLACFFCIFRNLKLCSMHFNLWTIILHYLYHMALGSYALKCFLQNDKALQVTFYHLTCTNRPPATYITKTCAALSTITWPMHSQLVKTYVRYRNEVGGETTKESHRKWFILKPPVVNSFLWGNLYMNMHRCTFTTFLYKLFCTNMQFY